MASIYNYVRKLRGYTITLTTLNTKYSLLSLLAAVDPTVPIFTRELNIQSDPGNTPAALIWIGDVNVSTSRKGAVMAVGQTKTYIIRTESSDIADIYVMSDTSGVKLNVEMVDF